MNQLENFGNTAKELVHVAHQTTVGLGLAPVPVMIILGLVALFALVGLVVGGNGRRPRGAHHA